VEEFNNFSVAIKATTKEIALKEKKKKTVDEDWELSINYTAASEMVGKLAYELGKREGLLSWGNRTEKVEAKKAIPLLERKIKHIRNLDGVKIMDLQFKLEDDLEQLRSELRVLISLKSRSPRHMMF
jgi:hypothetical protein